MSTITNSTNRVAGLMSGLDTEELVKAMTMNTKNKINSQKQKLQLLQWRQESYRSIISKISEFKNKFLRIESETSIKAAAVMKKYKTSISNDKVVSAVASADALPAKYTIKQASSAKAATIESGGAVSNGEIKLDFSGNTKNRQYFVDVELDGIKKTIEFRGGDGAAGVEEAGANFAKAVNEAFKDVLKEGQEFKVRFDEETNFSYLEFDSGDDGIRHSVCIDGGKYSTLLSLGFTGTAFSNITKSSPLGSISFNTPLMSSNGKYNININGVDFEFDDSTTIAEMIDTINNSKAGVVLTFSNVSQSFILESAETGSSSKLEVYQKNGNLLNAMFNWDNEVGKATNADSAPIIMERVQNAGLPLKDLYEKFKDGFESDKADDGIFRLHFDDPDKGELTLDLDVGSILSKEKLAESGKSEWDYQDIVDAFNEAFFNANDSDSFYTDENGNAITEFFKYTHQDGEDGSDDIDLMELDTTYGMRFASKGEHPNNAILNNLANRYNEFAGKDEIISDQAELIFDVDGKQVTVKGTAEDGSVTINDLVKSGLFEFSKGILTVANDKTIRMDSDPNAADFVKKYFGEDKEELQGAVYGEKTTVNGENSTITISNDGGRTFTTYTSANGSFTFDGTTINVNEMQDFNADPENGGDDYITIEVTKDNSAVLDVIKEFVEGYNTLLSDLYEEIGTNRPKSQGSYYDPLTEEMEEEMSEKEIENWNENAKTGLLYRDTNIQRFLSELRGVMTTRVNGFGLANMGIMVTANWEENGKLEIKNEDALVEAIELYGDKIADFFTGTAGFASKIEGVVDKAISTTTGKYGYLASLAGIEGTKTVDDNYMFRQIEYIQKIIDRLNEKYENEQKRYWSKYTRLEKYMANAQSQMSYFTDFGSSSY